MAIEEQRALSPREQEMLDFHVREMLKHLAEINAKHGRWHAGRARFRARCAAHFALDVMGRDGQ
jgi:hypothetical protein